LRVGDQADRIADVVAYEREDTDQRRSFENAFPGLAKRPRVPPAKTAEARLAELDKKRDDAGIRAKQLGNPTDWVRDFAVMSSRSDWPYRMLSAAAHGMPWAILTSEPGAAAPIDIAGGKVGEITASSGVTWVTTQIAIDTLARAVTEFEAYVAPSMETGVTNWGQAPAGPQDDPV
jgi:hypothetical protein